MARAAVVLLAAAAVGLAAYTKYGGNDAGNHAAAIQVVYAYSSNQEELLLPLIREFNDAQRELGGRRVEIVGESVSSGDAEAKIAAKSLRATLWSPASSLWGRLLDFDADAKWVADDNPA